MRKYSFKCFFGHCILPLVNWIEIFLISKMFKKGSKRWDMHRREFMILAFCVWVQQLAGADCVISIEYYWKLINNVSEIGNARLAAGPIWNAENMESLLGMNKDIAGCILTMLDCSWITKQYHMSIEVLINL